MFKISRLTDYGVVVLRSLVQRPQGEDRPMSARELSLASGLPQPTVSKLLKIMAKAELIAAKRGSMGGYELVRDPKDISLLQLFEAIEGPLAATSCMSELARSCQIEADCRQRHGWRLVQAKVVAVLKEISLFELIDDRSNHHAKGAH